MINRRRFCITSAASLSGLTAMSLLESSCGSAATVVGLVAGVANAAEGVVATLEGGGKITPGQASTIEAYLQQVVANASSAQQIILSGETGVKLASDIVGLFKNIQIPQLPAGDAAIIAAVIGAVQSLLAYFQPVIVTPPSPAQMKAVSKIQLSTADKDNLTLVGGKLQSLKARISALQQKK